MPQTLKKIGSSNAVAEQLSNDPVALEKNKTAVRQFLRGQVLTLDQLRQKHEERKSHSMSAAAHSSIGEERPVAALV